MLVPISKTHSISRVIANFFLAQGFAKPKFVFDKIILDNKLHHYHKKGLTSSKIINFENDSLNISNESNNGFMFEEFEKSGKTINLLKVENTNTSRALISIENRKYINWTDFKNRFIEDTTILSETFDMFVEAVSLTYVDEFIWNSEKEIDVKSIFNEESDLINKKFLNSYNGTIVLLSQSNTDNKSNIPEEKTEIIFNNQLRRIIVNHTYALKLNEVCVFSKNNSQVFKDYFDEAHKINKDILIELFSENVKESINLK